MSKMIDLTGKIYDNFKVLQRDTEKDKNKADRYVYWLCECFCDNHTVFSAKGVDINNGKVISCGCKKKTRSTNEEKIRFLLNKNNLNFKMEYSFPDCKSNERGSLFFDFAIFKDNNLHCLIEYNGKQHYYPVEYWGGQNGLEERQKRDKIKYEYCKENKIPLIIYSYLDKITEEKLIKDINSLETTNISIQQLEILKQNEIYKKQINGFRCALVDNKENILQIFNSFREAARAILQSNDVSHLREVCYGKRSHCNGYIFRLINSDNNIIYPEDGNFIWDKNQNRYIPNLRKKAKKICGISVFNKNDIIYYNSILDAATELKLSRNNIHKCLNGDQRFSQVGLRIWREIEEDRIVLNQINIDDIIEKYQKKYIYYEDEWQLIAEVARKRGLKTTTVAARIRKGKTKEEALEIKKR